MAWKSRIVGHDEINPQHIAENPRNWRIHPQGQRNAINSVLDEVGWVQDVVINKTTGYLVDGHLRVEAALEQGEESVPVVYVDLSEEEEALILSTLDPIGAMAEIDRQALADLVDTVSTDSATLNKLMDTLATDYDALSIGDFSEEEGTDESHLIDSQIQIMIICDDEAQQRQLLERFTQEGLQCRSLIS